MVNEQFVFEQLNIQFFIELFLMEDILYISFQLGYNLHICQYILMGHIQFNVQQHNIQFFSFQQEHILYEFFIHIQHSLFHMGYIQF